MSRFWGVVGYMRGVLTPGLECRHTSDKELRGLSQAALFILLTATAWAG